MPGLCELHPGICLSTEEKARKNLTQGKNLSQEEKLQSSSRKGQTEAPSGKARRPRVASFHLRWNPRRSLTDVLCLIQAYGMSVRVRKSVHLQHISPPKQAYVALENVAENIMYNNILR